MSIKVNLISSRDNENYQYGMKLKELFEGESLKKEFEGSVDIITDFQAVGQHPKDIDIVLYGSLEKAVFDLKTRIANKIISENKYCF